MTEPASDQEVARQRKKAVVTAILLGVVAVTIYALTYLQL